MPHPAPQLEFADPEDYQRFQQGDILGFIRDKDGSGAEAKCANAAPSCPRSHCAADARSRSSCAPPSIAMEAKGDCQRRHQERSDNSGGQFKCARGGVDEQVVHADSQRHDRHRVPGQRV
jgi:hypothetical protein